MPFAIVLPFIVIMVIITVARASAEQKKREAAKRRLEQMQMEQSVSVEGQAAYTPVRPSVQVPPVRRPLTTPTPTPNVQKTMQTTSAARPQKMHPNDELCALRPDPPVKKGAEQKHPEHELCALRPEQDHAEKPAAIPSLKLAGSTVNFSANEILTGVLFSEIFGKPKAMQ